MLGGVAGVAAVPRRAAIERPAIIVADEAPACRADVCERVTAGIPSSSSPELLPLCPKAKDPNSDIGAL